MSGACVALRLVKLVVRGGRGDATVTKGDAVYRREGTTLYSVVNTRSVKPRVMEGVYLRGRREREEGVGNVLTRVEREEVMELERRVVELEARVKEVVEEVKEARSGVRMMRRLCGGGRGRGVV